MSGLRGEFTFFERTRNALYARTNPPMESWDNDLYDDCRALLRSFSWFRCAWSDGVSFFTGRTSVGFIPVFFGAHAHACSYTRSDLAISTGFLALFTLACSRAFDSNPNKQRFLAIYFTYFSGVWPARLLRHRYPDRQRRVHSSTFSVTKKWCGDLFR